MKEELCAFKACESSKDFIISMEALIKPLGMKKIDLQCNSFTIFATFTQLK